MRNVRKNKLLFHLIDHLSRERTKYSMRIIKRKSLVTMENKSFILYSMFSSHNPQNKQMDSLDFVHVAVGIRHDLHLERILLYFLLVSHLEHNIKHPFIHLDTPTSANDMLAVRCWFSYEFHELRYFFKTFP